MKRLVKIIPVTIIPLGLLLYSVILALQRSDSETIEVAKSVDAFIVQYCREHDRLPTLGALQTRYPHLNWESGWFFQTDDKTFLIMQYPMKWWNKNAIGERRISEFTATVYAYSVAYKCKASK